MVDLAGKSNHIIAIIFFHTLYLNPCVNFLGPKFHYELVRLLDLGVSLVLDRR